MLVKHDFFWYRKIRNPLSYNHNDKDYVCTERLIRMIEKYGINAESPQTQLIHCTRIIHFLDMMTHEQINIVMSYKPDFVIRGYVYWIGPRDDKCIYILKKVLENDTDYKYITAPFKFGQFMYKNIYTFLKESNSLIDHFSKDPKWKENPKIQEYILISNHMKKAMSLFDLMMPHLEESNKKRRF